MKKILSLVVSLFFVLTLSGCCDHVWVEADCVTPKTCSECGTTSGEAVGHDTPDLTCTSSAICRRCLAVIDAPGHNIWTATCVEPEKCLNCGEIYSEAFGHSWIEANCVAPKTCNTCGEIEGEALGHTWIGEPSEEPRICSTCGAIEDLRIATPNSAYNYKYEEYYTVVEELTNAGFVNIETTVQYDVGTGAFDYGVNEIESISVDGNTEFEAGALFDKAVPIVITYRDLYINDPSIEYQYVTASTLIKELESNAMRARETYMDTYLEITGRISHIDTNGNFRMYPSDNQWEFRYITCRTQTRDQEDYLMELSADSIITIKGQVVYVDEYGYSIKIYKFN